MHVANSEIQPKEPALQLPGWVGFPVDPCSCLLKRVSTNCQLLEFQEGITVDRQFLLKGPFRKLRK